MKNKTPSLRKTAVVILLHFIAISLLGPLYLNCSQSGFQLRQKTPQAETGGSPPSGGITPPVTNGTNPLLKYAWHLINTGQQVFASSPAIAGFDMQLQSTWNSNIFGNNIKIQISDDGVEDTHEDLNANFLYDNTSKDYSLAPPYTRSSSPPKAADDNHGTNVAGLIAARRGNNVGASGVAPLAKITSANFISSAVTQTEATYYDQANGNFDISNMSWGSTQNTLFSPDPSYEAIIRNKVNTGRSGRGSIYAKAAGNDYVVGCNGDEESFCMGNSNFDPDNAMPYMIIAAALNARGYSASYSSSGSNIWISGFGGEFGDDSPAMLTTDRTGCSAGYAHSGSSSPVAFEKGGAENSNCNYTATFNGTSSAAPTIAGTVALMLEANANLSWRDVKYILAKTATTVNYNTVTSIPHPLGLSIPAGTQWEMPWIANQANFKFHNWYGFGRINVDAAVNMAKTYATSLGAYTETNWAHSSATLSQNIQDNSAAGATHTLSVTQNLKIEAVQLKIWVNHLDISELAIELTSPSGTRSILVNMRNSLTGIENYDGELFLSNAFYQESSMGNWTIKVIDGKASNQGQLIRWQLNFAGGL